MEFFFSFIDLKVECFFASYIILAMVLLIVKIVIVFIVNV
jgi:hypothetical protein